MSTLNVGTITNGSDSSTTQNIVDGIAKAWINYNAATASIRKSLNVASLTDNGTGDFTTTYTNNMTDALYASAGLAGGPTRLCQIGINDAFGNQTTSVFEAQTLVGGSTVVQDGTWNNITIFGDLA